MSMSDYNVVGDPNLAPTPPTPSSGGGHTIVDENASSMTQRDGLQFTGNVEVTDDAQGNKTVVEIKGTADHVYATLADAEADIANIKEGETVWTLEEGGTIVTRVEHLETNVANIEDDIDEINDRLTKLSDAVSVNITTTTTWANMLTALYNVTDLSKITAKSVLYVPTSNTSATIFQVCNIATTNANYTNASASDKGYNIQLTLSVHKAVIADTSGTVSDISNNAIGTASSGTVVLYY